jgi:D-cysteine desulfhydrase
VSGLKDLPLPRIDLAQAPTPVQPLGIPGVWVKRDDLAGDPFGGNKVRKLEWLLGSAHETGGDVLTSGTVGSNHLLATALYGQRIGVRVHAVVAPQPDSPRARENARALHACVEKLWVARKPAEVPVAWAKAWTSIRLFGGFPPVSIPIGGSSPLGCLGWVEAGMEIAAQVEAGELPAPERIYVAFGSGGTAAGLLVGLRLAGLRSEVVAVRAAPSWLATGPALRRLARRTLAFLRPYGWRPVALDGLRIVHDRFGPGYALPGPGTDDAIRAAAAEGLRLEATYTGKAFAALLAEGPHTASLFVHTANGRPMGPLLEAALDEVPGSLRGLLT